MQNSQPFVEMAKSNYSYGPIVTKKFSVHSTLGADKLNYTQLNDLRKHGALKGEYSCQDQTVADESRGSKSMDLRSGVWMFLLASWVCMLLFEVCTFTSL